MGAPGQSFASFFCLRSHTGSPGENLQIEDFDMTRLPEEQSARPLGGAKDERVALQQDDTEPDDDDKSTVYLRWNHPLILFFLGICQGITRRGTRRRNKIKIDKYCSKHYEDYQGLRP